MHPRLISLIGLAAMIGIAWMMSSHKRRVSPRIVVGGLLLQFTFALVILRTATGRQAFDIADRFFRQLIAYVDDGSMFLFGLFPQSDAEAAELPPAFALLRTFAFGVLPTIIFFSSLMSMLYHVGVMQRIVAALAWIMQKSLGTSGAESLSAAANIFVGQTEAPLVVRPYIGSMTLSELNSVMVGGFATIAGGVLAAYVGMGINAGHLLTASVISAPAALLIAKVMQPETEVSQTLGTVKVQLQRQHVNLIEAAAAGATDGMKLALNVAAMLIVFLALIAMVNGFLGWIGGWIGPRMGLSPEASQWTLQAALGYLFYPFAWLMGIPAKDCSLAGELLGVKMVANEFVAYASLSSPEVQQQLDPRSSMILTYAISGFANFSSIGIQLGGIGGIAPDRRGDLARLGLRAMIGGTLAAFMTACIAGILV